MGSIDLVAVAKARRLVKTGELRQRRLALGLKSAELAAQLGKTAATISRWETGDRTPNARDVVRWMRLLDRVEAGASTGGDAA